jgi:hypothetical protein
MSLAAAAPGSKIVDLADFHEPVSDFLALSGE